MNIKAILVETDKEPKAIQIDNRLQVIENIVSGHIDRILIEDNVELIVNKENILIDLPSNRIIFEGSTSIVGTFLIVSNLDDESNTIISLNEEQILKYLEEFKLDNQQDKIHKFSLDKVIGDAFISRINIKR